MGETSLARQLKKLATPQTNLLLQSKVRVSLLFDPKEASGLGKDIFYSYGVTGFDKLIQINALFERFQQLLFSENSKNFERSVQDATTNERLDKTIEQFLAMLSPYVLLKAAHEALEWLIYRFHIHTFNIDALITCVIPHYHTRIFVRVIQMLDFSSKSSRWYWLTDVKNSGKPLELSVLLHQYNVDPSFRKFVCELSGSILRLYHKDPSCCQVVVSFSVITTYYALKQHQNICESYVTSILPYIIKGLRSSNECYLAGTYMILATLMVKVNVVDEISKELILEIFKNISEGLARSAFEVLFLIYQQQAIKVVPLEVITYLSKNKIIAKLLHQVSIDYPNSTFSMRLIEKTLHYVFMDVGQNKKILLFLLNLLNHSHIEKEHVNTYLDLIVKFYIKSLRFSKKKAIPQRKNLSAALIKCLQNRFPGYFDQCIELYFKQNLSSIEKKVALLLLNKGISKFRHHVLQDSGLTVYLALNNPTVAIRQNAVNHLVKYVKHNKINDTDFVKSSLLDRITDDNENIVLEVLSLDDKLFNFIPQEVLMPILFQILTDCPTSKTQSQWNICSRILKLVCSQPCDFKNLDFLIALLPFLLPTTAKDKLFMSVILSSPLADQHPLLKVIKRTCAKLLTEDVSLLLLNQSVFLSVGLVVQEMNDYAKNNFVTYITETLDCKKVNSLAIVFTLFLLRHIHQDQWSDNAKMQIFNDIIQYIEKLVAFGRIGDSLYRIEIDMEGLLDSQLNLLEENTVPMCSLSYILQQLLEDVKIPFNGRVWWDPNLPKLQTLETFFLFLMKSTDEKNKFRSCFRTLLGNFFKMMFDNLHQYLWFLSHFWVFQDNNCCDNNVRIAIIEMCKSLCYERKLADWFLNTGYTGFPSLLVVLSSNDECVRQAALDFLDVQLETLPCDVVSPMKLLAEVIAAHKEEIKTDAEQLAIIIGNWLQPTVALFDFVTKSFTIELNSHTQVFQYLQYLICDFETPSAVNVVVLEILRHADSLKLLTTFLPKLQHYIALYNNKLGPFDANFLRVIELLLMNYSPHCAGSLTDDSMEVCVLETALMTTTTCGDQSHAVQEMALKVLTVPLFVAISSEEVRHTFLDTLLIISLDYDFSKINELINKTLRKLCIHAYLPLKQLPGNKHEFTLESSLKERRGCVFHTDSFSLKWLESTSWKKTIILLEIIQSKKHLQYKELLITEIFRILNLTLDWESQPSVEYIRQLLLASIHNCCSQFGHSELHESKFQIELIIQCIRSSSNPKTHHQALLVLNLAAVMFPDHVLNNIMSIFTFMGNSLVRQDDSYSFQVISQTIETIVPALQQASNQKEDANTVQVMASIIRMFVNSLPDIPQHRQLPLFTKLINTLGPSNYLWLPLAQICERYAYPSSFYDIYSSKSSVKEISPTLEFAITLHEQFPAEIQLDTCHHLVQHLTTLPLALSKDNNIVDTGEPFDISTHLNKELQDYKRNILCYLNKWLSSTSIISLLSGLETQQVISLEGQYKIILEEALNYLQVSSIAEKERKIDADYLLLLYDLLQNINALLPSKLFIKVTKKLLVNPMFDIRLKAVEMLSAKLEYHQKFVTCDEYKDLLKLLKPLWRIVGSDTDVSLKGNDELMKQNALLCVHLMCKILGEDYPMKFHKVLPVVIEILCHQQDQSKLIINALLCLAELSKCLNALMLPHLNVFMPAIMDLMSNMIQSSDNEYLILGVVVTLQCLVSNLGAFMNMYLVSIFRGVCELNIKSSGKPVLEEKLNELCKIISSEIPLRTFISATEECHSRLLLESPSAIGPLATLLSQRISNSELVDIVQFISPLQSFYINLLDFRNTVVSDLMTDAIEEKIITSLISLVMKMSEPTFNTFFSQVYLWAIPSSLDKDFKESKLRVLTFYRLACELSKNLRTLFILPAKKFLRHSVTILDASNSAKTNDTYFPSGKESVTLLHYIVDTLDACFQYDDGQLAEKEHFDVLMQPLVDQIENKLLYNDEAYQSYVENHLSKCLGHFVALYSDNALWKAMNYQVLLKTRHSSPKVRFAALQVIREMVKKMGDNYLVLLPESIPFLAEIMEDESFEVEQECQDVISEMEKILGEPIKKYF